MPDGSVSRLGGDIKGARAPSYLHGGMVDLVLASVFINILSLAMPLTLLQVYDRILPNNAENTLVLLVLGVGVALMLEVVLRIARSFASGWMGARFEHMVGCRALDRLMRSGITAFEQEGSGVHLERLNSLRVLKDYYAGQAYMTLWDLPFACLFLGVIAYLAGLLVLVPITLGILFGISAWIVGRRLRGVLTKRMVADDRRFNFIIEVLGGIHTVKGLAIENQMLRRYERLQEGCAEANFGVAMNSSHAMSVGAVFSQLTLFTVVGFGSTLVIDGNLTVGGLAACTMLAGRAMQPLQRAVGIWARFQTIALAREKVGKIFDLRAEAPMGLPQLPPVRGEIDLQAVAFGHGGEYPEIFREVNLHVAPGEAIGISGPNASGKTSLLYLMMSALQPTRGAVFLDGHNLAEYEPVSVRTQVAYLPQYGTLFNGSILDNITMFRSDRAQEALEIARYLGLDAVVAHMAKGYDTRVGDGATESLPRGIRQRIAVARALVDKPRIILFDEANTSMDGAGDANIRSVLENLKGHVTLVIVSHRPSTLRIADRIYDISEGTLVERAPGSTLPGFKPSSAQRDAKTMDAAQ